MESIQAGSACFFTQQLFLIGTYDEDGAPHFAPISWISFTWGPPACLVISISGHVRKKQTTQNLLRTGLLSATIVTPDLLPYTEQHNQSTRKDGADVAQEIVPGSVLQVPLIANAKWSYECEVIKSVRIGDCDTHFAAIRQVNIRPDVQALDFIDLREINPVIYSPDHYFTVGQHLGAIGDYSK